MLQFSNNSIGNIYLCIYISHFLTWLLADLPYWKLFSLDNLSCPFLLRNGCRKATVQFSVPLSVRTILGHPKMLPNKTNFLQVSSNCKLYHTSPLHEDNTQLSLRHHYLWWILQAKEPFSKSCSIMHVHVYIWEHLSNIIHLSISIPIYASMHSKPVCLQLIKAINVPTIRGSLQQLSICI